MEKKWRKNQLLCHFLCILWVHKNHNSLCDEGVRKGSVVIQKTQMVLDICPFCCLATCQCTAFFFCFNFLHKGCLCWRNWFFAEPYAQPSVMSVMVKQQIFCAEESLEGSVIVILKYFSNKTSILQQHEPGKPKMVPP